MKNRLLFCLFVLITGMFGIARAQGDELPLILWIRGDLYSVDALGAAPTPITTNGTISGAALAPDGKTIAYKVAAAGRLGRFEPHSDERLDRRFRSAGRH